MSVSCCGEDAVQVSRMAVQVRGGHMLRYKKRLFGKNWREEYVVLYNDSTLIWYKNKSQTEQEGGIVIKDAPELMAYGQFTERIPDRPELPNDCNINQLLAFGTRGKEQVHWFLCKNEDEVIAWLTAISNTLPPPPQPPQMHNPPQTASVEGQAPPGPPQSNAFMPPPPSAPPPIPGQYPAPTSGPLMPAYNTFISRPPMQQQVPNNTTVLVQDRRNDGDFAMGMLVGGALTSGWGCGWGWGGWGHGVGWGVGHGWTGYHDTDIHINNYYDVDNTTINNAANNNPEVETQEVMAQDDIFDTSGFDGGFDGDFDCGDFGGF